MEAQRRRELKARIDDLESALLAIDKVRTRRCFEESGLAPLAFGEWVVAVALERIGASWELGQVALSQVYMGGRICEDLLEQILPPDPARPARHPPMAIAVLDDFHPLGKRIVTSVLRANGFRIADYGQISVEDLVARVRAGGIRILLISTLMLPSALKVRELRTRLDESGLDVRLVVGGAPFRFDRELWREVGADATSDSASGAVGLLWRLAEGMTWTP